MNELYINIGSEKSCLFVKTSIFLIKTLERHPFLYYAIEEALECAKLGYYGIGILAFSQLLNLFNKDTPKSRHIVAHEFLKQRPSKDIYTTVLESLKKAAADRSDQEIEKTKSIENYHKKLEEEWMILIQDLHGIVVDIKHEDLTRPCDTSD
jgi:phosphomannomutase